MPDDEVKKLIKIKSRLFVGGARFGVNTIALANKPGQSERTMIEDFPSTPLEDLQDSFGIYKETLSKNHLISGKNAERIVSATGFNDQF